MISLTMGNRETLLHCDLQGQQLGMADEVGEGEQDVQEPKTKVPSFQPPRACFNFMVVANFRVQSLC
jgi:hypothetical protein